MISKTTSDKKVKYRSNPDKDAFIKVLKSNIDEYFEKNKISRHANMQMVIKTIVAITSWLLVYTLIMSNVFSNNPLLLILSFTLLGFINIFIAFNITHDACHNAYSSNKKINQLLAYSMNFIGGNSYLFRQMHNAHHAFVNIHGIDVTLETHGIFRFTPDEPYKKIHRWQHIYTFIVYAFSHIHWVLIKDFKWMFAETHIGNKKGIKHPFREYVILFLSKAIYLLLTLVLPLIFLSNPWWIIVLGFVSIHILPGLTFALIFQVTHIYDGTTYPLPDEKGNIYNSYAIHVLETTADFSRKNPVANWLMGCINIHVIHHILPGICHVHYPKLTSILADTAKEFGIEYNENRNFWVALKKHYKMLKHLSHPEAKVSRYGVNSSYTRNSEVSGII